MCVKDVQLVNATEVKVFSGNVDNNTKNIDGVDHARYRIIIAVDRPNPATSLASAVPWTITLMSDGNPIYNLSLYKPSVVLTREQLGPVIEGKLTAFTQVDPNVTQPMLLYVTMLRLARSLGEIDREKP